MPKLIIIFTTTNLIHYQFTDLFSQSSSKAINVNLNQEHDTKFLAGGVAFFGHTPLNCLGILKFMTPTTKPNFGFCFKNNELHSRIFGFALKSTSYPFNSMPRVASSLRIMRFIQAETEASPSILTASLIPFSSNGSTRNAICLLPLVLKVVDMGLSPRYSLSSVNQLYCNRHEKANAPKWCNTQGRSNQPSY